MRRVLSGARLLFQTSVMRKRSILVLVLLLGAIGILRAQSPIYLFTDFTDGSIALKNRTFVKTKYNYDTFHDKLLYMDGDQVMELTDYSDIVSVYIGDRTFVPLGGVLYEVVDLGDSPVVLMVKWHQKKNPIGKKGAYDQLNHASSSISIDPEYYSVSLKERGGEQVFNTIVENSYGLLFDGKFKKFSDKRSLLKLFPDRKAEIEAFITENHLLFSQPDDVIAICKFAVGK